MDKIRRLYSNIETFFSNRPIATTIFLTILGTLLPTTIISDAKQLLIKKYQLTGYTIYAFLIFQLFTVLITVRFFRQKTTRRKILKKIYSLLDKLDNPFTRQSPTISGKQIVEDKYYDYEMIKSFKEYNDILTEVKQKYPKEFQDLEPLINNKRIHPGDWIPESELNGVKISLLQLRQRIDEK